MSQLIIKVTDYVTELLTNSLDANCIYHNLTHTQRVFKSTKELIDNSTINEEEKEILLVASLFHDTGYIHGSKNHEYESVKIATNFLEKESLTKEFIDQVNECILSTKMDSTPTTELGKIIRDADSSHFAKDYFQEASEFLREELKLLKLASYSKQKWLSVNIDMLQNKHRFYTEYALNNWQSKKEENIKEIMKEQEKNKRKKKTAGQKKARIKRDDPDKAIQSMYRITLRNHIKLSDMADTKSNILLSVNAIIISIALSSLIPKLDNPSNSHLIIPTAIFLFFTVTSMVLSILATRPRVTSGKFTKEDVTNKKVNLLFFGNFYKMSLEEFDWAMNEMLKDKEYIYSSMTKDLYFLGLVLKKKYTILRLTYNIFMTGMIISVIAFTISFMTLET